MLKSIKLECKAWCLSDCVVNISSQKPLSDPVINAQFTLSGIVRTCLIYISIFIPNHPHDVECEKEYIRTVVDVKKIYDGVVGVPSAKLLFQEILKATDFEPKLPHYPVRSYNCLK